MTCISAYHQLTLNRVPGGMNVVDTVPDSDTAILRKVFVKKFLNGIEVLPQIIIPDYTANSTTFFLPEGFSYAINHEKTCTDKTVSKEYWGTFDIPAIAVPNKIDAQPTANTILMTVPLNNNYATIARYRRKETSFWYNNPDQNKTDKFVVGPLQPNTEYEVEVCYILADRVTSSAFTVFTVKTLPAFLSNIVLGPIGQRYFTCDAPLVQASCKTQVNGANDWYNNIANVKGGIYGLGKVLTADDVVTIVYEGNTYTLTAK